MCKNLITDATMYRYIELGKQIPGTISIDSRFPFILSADYAAPSAPTDADCGSTANAEQEHLYKTNHEGLEIDDTYGFYALIERLQNHDRPYNRKRACNEHVRAPPLSQVGS